MKQKNLLTITLLGGAFAGAFFGATRLSLPAGAAPAKVFSKDAAPAPVTGPLADAFSGKTYPLTLPAEKIDGSYRLMTLVDVQGKPALVATRGESITAGGDTFMVCYDVALTDAKTHPPQPKAGAIGTLLYVNLHMIQAMGGIIPITPSDTPSPTAAP